MAHPSIRPRLVRSLLLFAAADETYRFLIFDVMFNGPASPAPRTLRPGDHICSVYETDDGLVETVATFLVDGLARGERTWYVPSGAEIGRSAPN